MIPIYWIIIWIVNIIKKSLSKNINKKPWIYLEKLSPDKYKGIIRIRLFKSNIKFIVNLL